jgi:hypothetical protein
MANTIKVVKGDMQISSASGRPVIISGATKLKQELQEFLSIVILPSGFGSGLEQLVGLVPYGDVMTGLIDRQIRDGIAEFINIQQADSDTYRSPDEMVVGVSSILVQQDPQDPTQFYFKAAILTQSGINVPISLSLES